MIRASDFAELSAMMVVDMIEKPDVDDIIVRIELSEVACR
jgi:hypothetical protein